MAIGKRRLNLHRFDSAALAAALDIETDRLRALTAPTELETNQLGLLASIQRLRETNPGVVSLDDEELHALSVMLMLVIQRIETMPRALTRDERDLARRLRNLLDRTSGRP